MFVGVEWFCGCAAAAPETLAVRDLTHHPERWPETVTLKKDFQFGGGQSAAKGQKVTVMQFNGMEVGVNAGKDLLFECGMEDCDFVEAANAVWAKLTPAQRAIDAQSLEKDSSLWPQKVKCYLGFTLDNGKNIPDGTELDLVSLNQHEVTVHSRPDRATMATKIAQTDVFARARELAPIEPAKRPSRVAEALRKVMVDSNGKPYTSAALDDAQVFALYYGASWCGPCHAFSPQLIKYVNEVGPKNPKLMVVLISSDEKDADMLKYMTEQKMPWPAVSMAEMNKSPLLSSQIKGAIPQFVIMDRGGKVLADCYTARQYVGPQQPLRTLTHLVNTGAAK